MLSKYSNLIIKASLYMYSTPKYWANMVSSMTRAEVRILKISTINTTFESITSITENHRPRSI
jgi:hypothetical protein